MQKSRLLGLTIVAAAVGAAIAFKTWQQGQKASAVPELPKACDTCTTPPRKTATEKHKPPRIPPRSGRPCVVELGSTECTECRKMMHVLASVAPKLRGKVDVVTADVDEYPDMATQWRLRVIPTQLFLDGAGREVARHEGALTEQELLSKLRELGFLSAERKTAGRPKTGPARK